jgi:shikimate dehydrogenase
MIRAAVLGSPIAHSLSPQLHKIAYEYLEIEGEYSRFDVKSGQLPTFLTSHPDLNSLSLTMPLKEEALLVAETISPIALQIKSGNTLSKKDGKWELTSTDVEGFLKSWEFHGAQPTGSVLIIGSGATARAAAAACDSDARMKGREIHVLHRNPDRELGMRAAAPASSLIFHPWDSLSLINQMDAVINTTPAGIADVFCDQVSKPQGVLFESIYNPWPSRLMKSWTDFGAPTIDGIDLLVHQGISQIEIFSGLRIDRGALAELMRRKAIELLGESTER